MRVAGPFIRHCDREARPKREAIQKRLAPVRAAPGLLRRLTPPRNDGGGDAYSFRWRPRASFLRWRPRAPRCRVRGAAGAARSGLRVEPPEDREDAGGHSCIGVLALRDAAFAGRPRAPYPAFALNRPRIARTRGVILALASSRSAMPR